MSNRCVPPVLIPRTVKLHGRIDSFTMRSSAYSCLRRVISGAVAPSQPPPHLDWALLWPAPGHAKGGEHRLGIASVLSQSASLLRGRRRRRRRPRPRRGGCAAAASLKPPYVCVRCNPHATAATAKFILHSHLDRVIKLNSPQTS